jgi:preprotein translocase subunit YajC
VLAALNVIAVLAQGATPTTTTTTPGAPVAPAGPAGPGSLLNSLLLPLVLIFGVYWFLLINPRRKQQKELDALLGNLKKGDEVVTQGGIIGKITGLTDKTVVLEVQEKVRMKVLRSAVTGKAPSATSTGSTPENK